MFVFLLQKSTNVLAKTIVITMLHAQTLLVPTTVLAMMDLKEMVPVVKVNTNMK